MHQSNASQQTASAMYQSQSNPGTVYYQQHNPGMVYGSQNNSDLIYHQQGVNHCDLNAMHIDQGYENSTAFHSQAVCTNFYNEIDTAFHQQATLQHVYQQQTVQHINLQPSIQNVNQHLTIYVNQQQTLQHVNQQPPIHVDQQKLARVNQQPPAHVNHEPSVAMQTNVIEEMLPPRAAPRTNKLNKRTSINPPQSGVKVPFQQTPRNVQAQAQTFGSKHCTPKPTPVIVYHPHLGTQGHYNLYKQTGESLIQGLEVVRQSVMIAHNDIRRIESQTEHFLLQYHECTKHKAHLQYLPARELSAEEKREMETLLRQKVESLQQNLDSLVCQLVEAQLSLADRLRGNINQLQALQSMVLEDELIRWKREQQLHGNGAPMEETITLNAIQEWCETLAELIWLSRQQVRDADRVSNKIDMIKPPGLPDIIFQLTSHVTNLLSTLVTSTFVIEKQPPQVMKTNTRFTATVRLLVGGQLNVYMTPPQVKVIIITESQAQALIKSESKNINPSEVCGEIINNTGCMEYQPQNKQLSVSFRNMNLRKIKRAEKKGTESVMDEKLALLFQSRFNVGSNDLEFHVWTLSLPVAVIVHGNQESHGWATVTWDNAFAAPNRIPFHVPDKVPWGQLAETLNMKFSSATGHPLSKENLRFLAEKIFKMPLPGGDTELNAMMVSWSQFCKETLPDRNFTFWEWFYMVIKVTKEHLRVLWADGLIMGFIQKQKAEELLSSCVPGTFLLRFSDSELGGITIAFVDGEPAVVYSLQPFIARDLTLRSLADRVKDLPELKLLYQGTPKDDVFSKYYSQPEKEAVSNGYVKPVLKTHLPWFSGSPGAGTPQYAASPAYMQSPDGQRDTPSVHSSCYPAHAQVFENDMMYDELRSFDSEYNFDAIDFENIDQNVDPNFK